MTTTNILGGGAARPRKTLHKSKQTAASAKGLDEAMSTPRPNQVVKLAFNESKNRPAERLPFVGRNHIKSCKYGYWDVPAVGGYEGGKSAGDLLGIILMKHYRAFPDGEGHASILSWIVLSMFDRIESGLIQCGTREWESLKGQLVGLMNASNMCMSAFATDMGERLDEQSFEGLLQSCNQSLADSGVAKGWSPKEWFNATPNDAVRGGHHG